MATNKLKAELATDKAELDAVAAAEAAIADTTDGGDEEAEALVTAKSKVNVAPTLDAVKSLKITDFGMVSNEMARSILKAQGKEVKLQAPATVHSADYPR